MPRLKKRAKQLQAARKEKSRQEIQQNLEVEQISVEEGEEEEEEGDGFARERRHTQEEMAEEEAARDWEAEEGTKLVRKYKPHRRIPLVVAVTFDDDK